MATTLSRLKTLTVRKNIKSYEQLKRYVFTYCGDRLRTAVINHEGSMRDFFDAKSVSESACGMQRGLERTAPRKRGLGGCSMTIERRLKD